MSTVTGTLSLTYRHKWLGVAFIRLALLPALFGWMPSDRMADKLGRIACALMGPRCVVR